LPFSRKESEKKIEKKKKKKKKKEKRKKTDSSPFTCIFVYANTREP
jgi:hypothetical protein